MKNDFERMVGERPCYPEDAEKEERKRYDIILKRRYRKKRLDE